MQEANGGGAPASHAEWLRRLEPAAEAVVWAGEEGGQMAGRTHDPNSAASDQPSAYVDPRAAAPSFSVGIQISPQELDEFARHKALEKLIGRGCQIDPATWHARARVRRHDDGGVFVELEVS